MASGINLVFDNSGQTEDLTSVPALVTQNSGRIDYTKTIISLTAYCALRTVEVQCADLAELGTMKGRSIL